MGVIDVVEYSNEIKREADEILKDTGIFDTLSMFGTPHIIGSYAMNLMYNPDIDIVVEAKDLHGASMKALQTLVSGGCFEKIEYGDFVKFPRTHRPSGYILVLKTTRKDIKWEIEVWFLIESTRERCDVSHVCALLTPELRRTVLEFKQKMQERNISKHEISSEDIYCAVLEKGITDFEIFIAENYKK